MSFLTKFWDTIKHIFGGLSIEVKKLISEEVIPAVTIFLSLTKNPVIDTIIEAVSGGKITDAMIATFNEVLTKLLTGLHKTEDILNLSNHELLVYYANVWTGLTKEQQDAFTTQLAFETTKIFGGDEASAQSKIKAIINLEVASLKGEIPEAATV